MKKYVALFLILFSVLATASAQTPIEIPIPDVPAGQEAVVTFKLKAGEIPSGLPAILLQGIVSGQNFAGVLTDDPSLDGQTDPTRLFVGLNVTQLPATGETPAWRLPLLVVLFGLALFALGRGMWLLRHR